MRDFGTPSHDQWDGPEESDSAAQIPAFLMDPLGIVERRWPVMLAAVLLGLVATVYAVAQAQPAFLATATVLVTDPEVDTKFVRTTVSENTIANIDSLLGKVQSQEKLAKLIEQHGLYTELREVYPLSELATIMRRNIQVAPQEALTQSRRRHGESSVIYAISFMNTDPVRAADIANALSGLLQEASIEARTRQARNTTSFLERQLEVDEAEYRTEAQRVSDYRGLHRGTLPDELQTNLRKLELLGTQRQSLVAQIADAETRLMTVGSGTLESQLAEVRAQYTRASALYTEDHPNVQALRYQLERLEEAVLSKDPSAGHPEYGGALATGQSEISALRSQLWQLDQDIADLNSRVDATPAIAEQLEAMEQKVEVLRATYHATLDKVEQAQLSQNFENSQLGAQVQLLDAAAPPTEPTRSRRLLALLGLAASLGLAGGLAVLLELFDPVIVAPDQLERIMGRPVLGSMPRLA